MSKLYRYDNITFGDLNHLEEIDSFITFGFNLDYVALPGIKNITEGILFQNTGNIYLDNIEFIHNSTIFNNKGLILINKKFNFNTISTKLFNNIFEKCSSNSTHYINKMDMQISMRNRKLNIILNG